MQIRGAYFPATSWLSPHAALPPPSPHADAQRCKAERQESENLIYLKGKKKNPSCMSLRLSVSPLAERGMNTKNVQT